VQGIKSPTEEKEAYAWDHSQRFHPAQLQLIKVTQRQPGSMMMGSPDEIQLLQNLAFAIGARKTLDIGVYTGYSAMSIALVLPDDGKVVACDVTDEAAALGRPVWRSAGVEHKIQFVKGPALDTLQRLIESGEEGTFDFAFIDADKLNYDNYYELCLRLVRPRGLIVLDNMLWSGSVCNPSMNEPSTVALRRMGDKIHSDERVQSSYLTIGDGIVICVKR
jgi:caffeoyl-CoA O-methyltransferase